MITLWYASSDKYKWELLYDFVYNVSAQPLEQEVVFNVYCLSV